MGLPTKPVQPWMILAPSTPPAEGQVEEEEAVHQLAPQPPNDDDREIHIKSIAMRADEVSRLTGIAVKDRLFQIVCFLASHYTDFDSFFSLVQLQAPFNFSGDAIGKLYRDPELLRQSFRNSSSKIVGVTLWGVLRLFDFYEASNEAVRQAKSFACDFRRLLDLHTQEPKNRARFASDKEGLPIRGVVLTSVASKDVLIKYPVEHSVPRFPLPSSSSKRKRVAIDDEDDNDDLFFAPAVIPVPVASTNIDNDDDDDDDDAFTPPHSNRRKDFPLFTSATDDGHLHRRRRRRNDNTNDNNGTLSPMLLPLPVPPLLLPPSSPSIVSRARSDSEATVDYPIGGPIEPTAATAATAATDAIALAKEVIDQVRHNQAVKDAENSKLIALAMHLAGM
jgi:hypothetical protein